MDIAARLDDDSGHRKDAARDHAKRQYAQSLLVHMVMAQQSLDTGAMDAFTRHTAAMDILTKEVPELRPVE